MTYVKHDLVLHAQANNLGGIVDGCPKCDEATPARQMEKVNEAFNLLAPKPSFASVPWQIDPEMLFKFLVRAACPIVCHGFVVEPERWHDLCIEKAHKAMEALGWGDLVDADGKATV